MSGIAIIAISKGPERNAGKEFYHQAGRESFALPFASPLAFYMQNIRDEAHRFAIGTHRKNAENRSSVPNLMKLRESAAGAKALLNYFGSAEAVAQAGLKDIEDVPGISKNGGKNI